MSKQRYWERKANHFERVGYTAAWFEARLRLLDGLKSGRVVDIGCGSGELVVAMLRRGINAYGVDIAANMVAKAQRALRKAGFSPKRIKQGDATRLPCASCTVDVVISTGLLGLLTPAQQNAALTEMSRITRYEIRLLEPYRREESLEFTDVLGLFMDGQRPLTDAQLAATNLVLTPHWDAIMGVFTYLQLEKHDVLLPVGL